MKRLSNSPLAEAAFDDGISRPDGANMLTDAALKRLKPKDEDYKVTDRDGMYAVVKMSGTVIFRYDYRLNGRRETLTIGRYGDDGVSLARAREKCTQARRAVEDGRSPAQEKQREKRRINKEAKSLGEFAERWFKEAPMAESTRSMRRSIFERDVLPVWKNRLLTEITPDDLRALCMKMKDRGAPATAIHVRDIIKQIYGFAILHGEKIPNPADEVGPASIASFAPRDRALSPTEIRIVLDQLEHVATFPTIRLGLRLILLTMVRKSELTDAVWTEVNFENAVWSIPILDALRCRTLSSRNPDDVDAVHWADWTPPSDATISPLHRNENCRLC